MPMHICSCVIMDRSNRADIKVVFPAPGIPAIETTARAAGYSFGEKRFNNVSGISFIGIILS